MQQDDRDASTSSDLQPETLWLKARLSAARWARVRARAEERALFLDRVESARSDGMSWRRALAATAPGVGWSAFQHWRRCQASRAGAAWERQLDRRVPPPRRALPAEVRAAAVDLRKVSADVTVEDAQRDLLELFGPEFGKVSGTSLKRLWREAGLARPHGKRRQREDQGQEEGCREAVSRYCGGAGLALLAAAAAETGVVLELANAVLADGKLAAAAQGDIDEPEEVEGRDARGRFTAEYNRAVRGLAVQDPRWDSDSQKRARRRLASLPTLRSSPEVLGRRLLSIGLAPLLTERRGFDGLDGPNGAWLGLLGGTAYRAATLDRQLSELGLLGSDEALWTAHAGQWERVTRAWWTEDERPRWLRWTVYVDATQDPYWTRKYAASGKVSRVGKVMPCLTRVALMGGGGVPLVVETRAGSVSLKKELLPFLERAEAKLGDGELGRLTVVDAEMSTVPLLMAMAARPKKWFITVLKGALGRHARRSEEGEWSPYRSQDQLRELVVHVHGAKAPEGGLRLRAVEMVRRGSRNPTSTLFVTDASFDELSTQEVASAYLSRWPNQEQRFRDSRNGIGLNRSHGYGGQCVTHVALETAMEKATRREERAQARIGATDVAEQKTRGLRDATERGHRAAANAALRRAERDHTAAKRAKVKATEQRKRLQTTPREIYVRDTTRDGIATCLKLTVLMLFEFVLKEYFTGVRMEARTFIEAFAHLPVTVRTTQSQILYQFDDNPRDRRQSSRLRDACAEVTSRGIQVGQRRLRFEIAPPDSG